MRDDNNNEEDLSKYHKLVNSKIGYGKAQHKLGLPTTLLVFSEGCEIITLGLILPILTKEWSLSVNDQALLLTVIVAGIPIGTMLQGFADHYGRAFFITVNATLLVLFGLISVVCWNFLSFMIARCLYCVGVGISMNLTVTYLNQISPTYMKSTLMTRPFIFFSIGSVLACVLAWVLLQKDQWRLMLLVICLPGLIALITHIAIGRESLHYLWVQKRKETVEMIDYMCELNERPLIPREEIIEEMMDDHDEDDEQMPLSYLFSQTYLGTTIRLMPIWITNVFFYNGLTLLIPTFLQKVFEHSKEDLSFKYLSMMGISVMEMFGYIITPYLIEHPQLGLKKVLYLILLVKCLTSLSLMITGSKHKQILCFLLGITKLCNSLSYQVTIIYTSQLYETMVRSKAMTTCSILGKTSVVFIGLIGVKALHWMDGTGLFLIFVLLSAVGTYCAVTMPQKKLF